MASKPMSINGYMKKSVVVNLTPEEARTVWNTFQNHVDVQDEEGEDLDTIEKVIRRQGVGVYKLNGNVYEGEWDQDKMHGHGEH